jgi:hypothetical protein
MNISFPWRNDTHFSDLQFRIPPTVINPPEIERFLSPTLLTRDWNYRAPLVATNLRQSRRRAIFVWGEWDDPVFYRTQKKSRVAGDNLSLRLQSKINMWDFYSVWNWPHELLGVCPNAVRASKVCQLCLEQPFGFVHPSTETETLCRVPFNILSTFRGSNLDSDNNYTRLG